MTAKMKNLSFEDIIGDEKLNKTKKVLSAKTTKGKITIEATKTMISATTEAGNVIAMTYNVNEKGLRWIKKECRGYHDYNRLKWIIEDKK